MMLWMSFARWSATAGSLLITKRIYVRGHWTPLVTLKRRYPWRSVWRGVWPRPPLPETPPSLRDPY